MSILAKKERKRKMYSCEGTGKNIEQAINNALLELKAAREDVDIKILSEGGFLKKAKVLVTISEDSIEKYQKREELKKELVKEENDEDFAENFMKRKVETTEEKPQEKAEAEEKKEERKITIIADEEYVSNKTEEKKEIEKVDKPTPEEFIQGVLASMDLTGEIEKTEDEKFVRFEVTGENLNDLIGHHGDCMLALSHLMNVACKTEDRKRVVLDIEHYRERRAEALTELARRVASKVVKSGRYYKFEPMDASERKIIHTALQEDDRVTTLSKGEEPHRYLIVFPKEYNDRD